MPLPLIVGIAVRIGIAAAGKIIAKQAASAAVKQAAKAAAKKAAEEAAKKAAAQGLGRQAGTTAARDAAKKAAQRSLDDAAKAAKKSGGKGPPNTAGKHKAKKDKPKRKKDPCKHPNDTKKKRKYVVYKVKDRSGKVYVGRTSGKPGESVESILRRRSLSHHRTGVRGLNLQRVFTTDSYAAVRGAEQIAKELYGSADQIEPISDRNESRQDYIDCAKSKM